MCPIVPTFTCGLLRSNFSFAISRHLRIRDFAAAAAFCSFTQVRRYHRTMERGTGFEPATICLEGRDSTPELPPLVPTPRCPTPANTPLRPLVAGAWDRD